MSRSGDEPQGDAARTYERRVPEAQVREAQEAVAVRVRERLPEVLERWERHARADVPAARDLDRETLYNNLPQVLEQIAAVLVSSIGQDAYFYAEIPASREHAEQRARLEGYSLDQVILEYHLLRKVLVEVLEQDAPLPRGIGSVVHDGIDRAMQEAAVHYVATHAEVCRAHEARQQTLTEQADTLREADRAKDDYLAVLAHELRTPLGTITNALHLLGELNLADERAFRYLGVASRQTATLSRMVEDLLDVSRIVRGKLEIRAEPVDLCRVAAQAAQTVGPLIEAHAHTLEVSFPAGAVWVEADPVRLEQVVNNLLTNATKYTEPGGRLWLTVTCEPGEALLCVRDTGIGISPEQLRQVFGLFNWG